MTLPPFSWPPVVSRDDSSAPVLSSPGDDGPIRSVIQTILTGNNADIVPAPPAGFGYLITDVMIKNNDAALPAGPILITEGGLQLFGITAIAAAGISTNFAAPHVALGAVNMSVAGAAASATISLVYQRVPTSTLFRYQIALTNVFQAINLAGIPAGMFARPVGVGSASATLWSQAGVRTWWVANQDGAARGLQMRVTRGGVIFDFTPVVTIATDQRTNVPNAVFHPPLLSTDVFEVRTTVAVITPGKVTLGGAYLLVENGG